MVVIAGLPLIDTAFGAHASPPERGGGEAAEDLLAGDCLSSLSPLISTLLKCNPASLLHQDWKAAIESHSAMLGALHWRDTPKGTGTGVVHTYSMYAHAHTPENTQTLQSKTNTYIVLGTHLSQVFRCVLGRMYVKWNICINQFKTNSVS